MIEKILKAYDVVSNDIQVVKNNTVIRNSIQKKLSDLLSIDVFIVDNNNPDVVVANLFWYESGMEQTMKLVFSDVELSDDEIETL